HQFCCRSHASEMTGVQQPVKGTCALSGCTKSRCHDPNTGEESPYCSRGHAKEGGFIDRVFYGSTGGTSNFSLSLLLPSHKAFISVRNQFISKWGKKDVPVPTVERVFKIQVQDDVEERHKAYTGTMNKVRRFHGTSASRDCGFFTDLTASPCTRTDCNVCSICTHGFTFKGVGGTARRTSIGLRYGKGLYFSSVSGKSNDYAVGSSKVADGKTYRCMFMCTVVSGKAYKTKSGSLPDTECPPQGYDSVVGEV
ncbi:unnamed protein product, partial [Choristocarpus tenellus]